MRAIPSLGTPKASGRVEQTDGEAALRATRPYLGRGRARRGPAARPLPALARQDAPARWPRLKTKAASWPGLIVRRSCARSARLAQPGSVRVAVLFVSFASATALPESTVTETVQPPGP